MLAYNTSVHSTTKYSPYELLFGNKPYLPNSVYDSSPDATYPEYVNVLQHRLKYSRDRALENIQKSKETSKTYYDTHSRPIKYQVGDYVFIKQH